MKKCSALLGLLAIALLAGPAFADNCNCPQQIVAPQVQQIIAQPAYVAPVQRVIVQQQYAAPLVQRVIVPYQQVQRVVVQRQVIAQPRVSLNLRIR